MDVKNIFQGFTPLEVFGRKNFFWKFFLRPMANGETNSRSFREKSGYQRSRLLAGFTLVEMLVVIAVAVMILSVVLALFSSARAKTRDTIREEHMKTIQNALALHVNTRGSYPVYTGVLSGSDTVSVELRNSDSLQQMPRDPLNAGTYVYFYASANGTTYTITYYLETNNIPGKSAGVQTAGP